MEKTLVLNAETRDKTGSSPTQKGRRQGKVPAIIYGHKKDAIAVWLDEHSFVEGVHHGRRLLDINLGDKKETTIIKELQFDHLGKNIIHADLMRVDVTETVKVNVPVELKGPAKGTHDGGIVSQHLDRIEVECRVTDIPESLVVSIKELGVGEGMRVGDIPLPAGVKLVTDANTMLVSCNVVAEPKTMEQVEAEAPTSPEVITEKKKEGEEEAAEEEK